MSLVKLNQHQLLLLEGKKIIDAPGKTFFPLAALMLQDLSAHEHHVLAISNHFSERNSAASAAEIDLARISNPGCPEALQSYHLPDGQRTASTSIGIKHREGEYAMAICLNTTPGMLSPVHGRAAIPQLSQAGLMDFKNAQGIVVNTLGIAHSKVYTCLQQGGSTT